MSLPWPGTETDTGRLTTHNLQPWRFVQVESVFAKEKLGAALTGKMRTDMDAEGAEPAQITKRVEISLRRIDEAPVIILLCRDKIAIRKEEPEEEIMGIQSVALAGLQLMLAAHAEDLGANWICWPLYAQQEIIDILDLSKNWQPEAMIFLGYADEEPKDAARVSAKELKIFK